MLLYEENGYLLDFEKIDFVVLEKVKFMFLNYLNNLMGVVVDVVFYVKVVVFVKEYNIYLIYDFVYGVFEFDKKLVSFFGVEDVKVVGVEFYLFLKIFNMVGWRMVFVVGNEKII